jgi:hypothetical protein
MRLAILCTIALAGCAPMNVGGLEPPASTLLKTPAPIPEVKEGDNLAVDNSKVRHVCSVTTDKFIRLQRYVKIILKKDQS